MLNGSSDSLGQATRVIDEDVVTATTIAKILPKQADRFTPTVNIPQTLHPSPGLALVIENHLMLLASQPNLPSRKSLPESAAVIRITANNKTKQNKTKQNKTKQNTTRQNKNKTKQKQNKNKTKTKQKQNKNKTKTIKQSNKTHTHTHQHTLRRDKELVRRVQQSREKGNAGNPARTFWHLLTI